MVMVTLPACAVVPLRREGRMSTGVVRGITGSLKGVLYDAASSRAIPLWQRRSGRLGPTSTTSR